jgi:hypothetical protein
MRVGCLAWVGLVIIVLAWWFAWQVVLPPPVTCELPTRPELCKATLVGHWEGLNWRRPIDIRVHEFPESWRDLPHERFRGAEWGATLGRYLDPPWEAACYLEDDGTATCYAGQFGVSED